MDRNEKKKEYRLKEKALMHGTTVEELRYQADLERIQYENKKLSYLNRIERTTGKIEVLGFEMERANINLQIFKDDLENLEKLKLEIDEAYHRS